MPEYPSGYPAPSGGGLLTPVGGVRKDVSATIADADGDFGPVQLDASGALRVTLAGSQVLYSAAIDDLAAANTCTDLLRISGSATKTVFVQEIRISATATAGKTLDIRLARRSTANSGGTASQPTVVKHDTDSAAGTAVVDAYTANPTVGTLVGLLRSTRYTIVAVDVQPCPELVFDLRKDGGIRLEGVAQGLTIELDGETAGAGNAFSISVTWSEAPTTA